jgi:hypothetical protein
MEKFRPLGLKVSQFELIKRDELFNYELKLSMFNGNGMFSQNAERVEISFVNGATLADFTLIARSVLSFHEAAQLPEDYVSVFNAFVHAKPSSDADRESYFSDYGNKSQGFTVVGLIASVHRPIWEEVIRVHIDRSAIYPAWLYVNWSTRSVGKSLSEKVLADLRLAIDEAGKTCGLDFASLK